MPALVIAEAGVNHNGSLKAALELVDAAQGAGADIVKFQTFCAADLVTEDAPRAQYQSRALGGSESQREMLARLELSHPDHRQLAAHCIRRGIGFLSTAFDRGSLAFLTDDLGLRDLKIPSGELTNAPLLLDHARRARTLIVSTGMATLGEVEAALGVIAFGMTAPADAVPTPIAFASAFASSSGQSALRERVIVLHCTSEYPAPIDQVNLRAMVTLGRTFGLRWGYSDHTEGATVAIAAVALGAEVIEKHLTLDRTMVGPDHQASLEPADLKAMVQAIRDVESAMGDGVKRPTAAEVGTRAVARKSLVALAPIEAGELLGEHNLGIKRPGTGLAPDRWWALQGKRATRGYAAGDLMVEEA